MEAEIKEPISNTMMFALLGISLVSVGAAFWIKIKYQKYNDAIKEYNNNPRISKPRKSRRKLRQRQNRINLAIKKEKLENEN